MKGDFSRGYNPDRKRGRVYRRVLAQEGRLILDSDVNALVDAQDHTLRRMAEDFGCRKGSPDLGFLVTPGRLLALFRTLGHVSVSAGDLDVHRAYQHKYLDRYPSLYLGNSSGAAGTATIALRAPTSGAAVRLWVRSEAATTVNVLAPGDLAFNHPDFQPHEVTPPAGTAELQVTLDSGEEIWIGLIEEDEDAGSAPRLWSAEGSYYVDGLLVDQDGDGSYPEIHFDPFTGVPLDPPAGFEIPDLELNGAPLQPGDRVVAYLEAWERHLTAVEDGGILEIALGGRDDTTTRTHALGQVKLVATTAALTAAQIAAAISDPAPASGILEVTTPVIVGPPDPCDLPLQGGYTGSDNRLYRFEVHVGGGLADCLIKWSRNNGSDLFRAGDVAMVGPNVTELSFAEHVPLASGDLVEVLDEFRDLEDQAFGVLDTAAATFTPPERRAGRLVRLQLVSAPGAALKTFAMTEPDDDAIPVTLPGFGNPPDPLPKVRLWHGLIDPDGVADPYVQQLEDGIEVSLTGTFRVGDWWQHEARAAGSNANGIPPLNAHGPERLFAPLALLQFQGDDEPLLLLAWLDHRFPSLCSITADDVSFDPAGTGAEECGDTVQEVLECLLEREMGGCCEHTIHPEENGDDAQQVLDILAEFPGDVQICLEPGVYHFQTTIQVADRRLSLHGCPSATIEAMADPPFELGDGGGLTLRDLTLFAPASAPVGELVAVDGDARGVEALRTALVIADPTGQQAAIRLQGAPPPQVDEHAPGTSLLWSSGVAGTPAILLEECIVVAGWAVIAAACSQLEVRRSACWCLAGGLAARGAGRLDVTDSILVAGVALAATDAWTADGLEENGEDLLDSIAVPPPVPGGEAAVAMGYIGGGRIAGSRLYAHVCVAIRRGFDCTLSDNVHFGNVVGISMYQGVRFAVRSERVHLVDEDAFAGIQLARFADALAIEGCTVTGPFAGILLAADILPTQQDLALTRQLDGVRIAGNRVEAQQCGIQLGFLGQTTIPGWTVAEVRDNEVRSPGAGIALCGELVALPPQGGQPELVPVRSRIRAAGNLVHAPVGIWISGAGHEVADNRVVLPLGEDFQQVAYFADAAPGFVWEDNLAESREDALSDGAAAYWVRDGSGGRLAGNVARTPRRATGLLVSNHPRLRLAGNDFGVCDCRLANVADVEIQANRTTGVLAVTATQDGTVHDNRVGLSLSITGARGEWQIEDNRVEGTLQLLPVTTGGFSPWIVGDYTFYGRIAQPGRTSFEVLASDPGGEAGPSTASRFGVNTYTDAVSFAVDNPQWRAAWTDVARFEIADGALSPFRDRGLFDDFVIAFPFSQEVSYQAQLVGNWCGLLQVGHTNDNIGSGGGTVVQVAANRADEILRVRQYARSLVADNAAGDYSNWIQTQPAVNVDNLEF
ncbi:MAG TPA: hypothetical protein VN493_19510 [Thermoanaerobaculia bacterium]|nr:hypothetical protein [Thermoanaerobaculia bacterium]